MVIQLYFENPLYVSAALRTSQLNIVLNGEASDVNGNHLQPNTTLKREIPRQMDSQSGEVTEQVASLAANSVKSVFGVSFILNLFFIGGLAQILSMIQNLSVIVHMQLVNVQSPPNVQGFFSKILSIVAFDVMDGLPVEDWLTETLDMPVTQPLMINFDTLGYQSSLFIQNMGSVFFIYILFPIFIILTLLTIKTSTWCVTLQNKAKHVLNRMFFNSILRFIEETYLITTLCSFINLRKVLDQ